MRFPFSLPRIRIPIPHGRLRRLCVSPYGLPLVLALVVHAVAALALAEGWGSPRESERHVIREAVSARLLTLEAQAPEPAEAAARPRPQPERERPRQEPAPQPLPTEPEPARPEREEPRLTAPAEPEPEPEPERRQPRDDRWREDVEDSFARALEAESERMAEREADEVAGSYIGGIIAQIERHWSRPPSARRGMQVELRISLVPSGDLVDISVVRSSGNSAFDRSAELAVRQAAPFQVPADSAVFEQRFRRLRLVFTPEDLRNR